MKLLRISLAASRTESSTPIVTTREVIAFEIDSIGWYSSTRSHEGWSTQADPIPGVWEP